MQDRQAVTSSVNIATTFDKQHGHVLWDIRNLQKDVSNFGKMFSESMTL
ncbi:Rha family transcriptional regulator [Sporosarcina sp. G11-34]|nr:Rha family transcriptional regulator [Sporosarcina sp. G11-34]